MKACGLLITTIVSMVMAGCLGFGGEEYPDKRYYDLEVRRSGAELRKAPGTVLKLRTVKISRRYESNEIVYRLGDGTWESDFYNVFFADPASMITEETQRWIVSAGIFEHTLGSGAAVAPTHILDGAVVALYGDYRDKTAPKAVLEMQIFLVDDRGEVPVVVFRKESRKEVPLPDDSVPALIEGLNKALAGILGEMETGIAGVLSSR